MVSLGKKKRERELGATLRRISSFLLTVSLTLSLGDVGGGGGGRDDDGGTAGRGTTGAVLGWLETFRESKIAASKCKGSRRQGSRQETPWREAGESGEGARFGERVRVGDPLTRCQQH